MLLAGELERHEYAVVGLPVVPAGAVEEFPADPITLSGWTWPRMIDCGVELVAAEFGHQPAPGLLVQPPADEFLHVLEPVLVDIAERQFPELLRREGVGVLLQDRLAPAVLVVRDVEPRGERGPSPSRWRVNGQELLRCQRARMYFTSPSTPAFSTKAIMLAGRRILVAEDEALLAIDLALSIQDALGQVVGPVATVAEALVLLENEVIEAAILDVHLTDRDIVPVAKALLANGAAVIFHTASEIPGEIIATFGAVAICPKPMASEAVVHRLKRAIDDAGAAKG